MTDRGPSEDVDLRWPQRDRCDTGMRSDAPFRPCPFRVRKSHPEQIWSALPQIADIDFSHDDYSIGPKATFTPTVRTACYAPSVNVGAAGTSPSWYNPYKD
jgi:hypothetical protein